MGRRRGGEGRLRRRVGLVVGPALLAATLLLPAPEGLTAGAWRTVGTGLLMATWWVTEAIPLAATALLPLALLPALGSAELDAAAAPYANPLIFLFLGGFLLAAGMERWGLPRRIALTVVGAVGPSPGAVVAGFMGSAAFLSMWVSNTATAVMMLPIGLSVLELVRERRGEGDPRGHFGTALMLGIAYACSIGGVGTLIGTPPNAFLAGFLSETYGVEVTFVRWMVFGLPVVVVGLPLAWWVLTRLVFPHDMEEIPGGRAFLREKRAGLGPWSTPERRVAAVFAAVAVAWVTRPVLERWVPGLSDAGIAVTGGLLLFLLPSGEGRGGALLSWSEAEGIPWGVLVLFGGGLSLAAAIHDTGVTAWVGRASAGLGGLPVLLVIGGAAGLVIVLTELTSNTATTAAFLPVLASVAVGVGQDPRTLVVPAALAASCAFMLPVATPPNAIVYGSEAVTAPRMARAGAVLNLLFLLLITLAARLLLPLVFGVRFGALPPWAAG